MKYKVSRHGRIMIDRKRSLDTLYLVLDTPLTYGKYL